MVFVVVITTVLVILFVIVMMIVVVLVNVLVIRCVLVSIIKLDNWGKYKKHKEQKEITLSIKLFVRSGYCSRCGDCCSSCKYLSFEDGLATCSKQDTKSDSCKDFPLIRHGKYEERYPNCTYTWELDTSLTKEEALRRLTERCNICNSFVEDCVNRKELLDLINERLV
jgi:hypothetical protein